jgi:hypothetical protein
VDRMTYCQLDVMSLDAKLLEEFESRVSGFKYLKVDGYAQPVPTEHVALVPQQLNQDWTESLEGLNCNTVNHYRALTELEPDEWPDPGWQLMRSQSPPVHCSRYTFQPASHLIPTAHLRAASKTFSGLRLGLCWLAMSAGSAELGKQEIRDGMLLDMQLHKQKIDPEEFAERTWHWLGIRMVDEDKEIEPFQLNG